MTLSCLQSLPEVCVAQKGSDKDCVRSRVGKAGLVGGSSRP